MRYLFFILIIIFLALSGCTPNSSASSDPSNRTVSNTYRLDKNIIKFALYYDMDGIVLVENGNSTYLSSHAGPINSRTRIELSADLTSIKIAKHEYSLAKGRVFLISGDSHNPEIQQLDIPLRKFESFSDEVERLNKIPQIKNFYDKKTDNN